MSRKNHIKNVENSNFPPNFCTITPENMPCAKFKGFLRKNSGKIQRFCKVSDLDLPHFNPQTP